MKDMQLPPGPKLDALIAEEVMGFKIFDFTEENNRTQAGHPSRYPGLSQRIYFNIGGEPKDPPPYSTKISVAWELLDANNAGNPHVDYNDTEGMWRVEFMDIDHETVAYADTAPHAICLSTLKLRKVV